MMTTACCLSLLWPGLPIYYDDDLCRLGVRSTLYGAHLNLPVLSALIECLVRHRPRHFTESVPTDVWDPLRDFTWMIWVAHWFQNNFLSCPKYGVYWLTQLNNCKCLIQLSNFYSVIQSHTLILPTLQIFNGFAIVNLLLLVNWTDFRIFQFSIFTLP